MSDSARPKSGPRTTSRGSNFSQNNTSAQSSRSFSPQADLEAQIIASPSPVSSATDARSWLESKGWILNSEANSGLKLADILFSASLSFKLPADASSAIRAVAFLLRAHADELLSTTVADAIIDKTIDKLNGPLDKLNDTINVTKEFLEATSQKQAAELLSLQESLILHSSSVKSLAEVADKATHNNNPRGLPDSAWPQLVGANHVAHRQSSAILPLVQGSERYGPKVAQRVALATKQLMLDYGPLDEGEEPCPKTIKAQRELCQLFNGWIDKGNSSDVTDGQPPNGPTRAVRSVSIFDRPSILLEFDTADSKIQFVDMINKNPALLAELNPRTRIRPRTYSVIFCFVPCNGPFDPNADEHLRNIENDNDLPANSIVAASWCKRPDRRSPSQTTATLKVACTNPDIANHLLTGRIRVEDHLVTVRKDIRIPLRCVKCQEYGHTQDACIGVEKCANCASEFHQSANCDRPPACVSCGPSSQHPSTSSTCPTFMQKCDALDLRFPENSMPYFPSTETWTWAAAPANPPPPSTSLPPPPAVRPQA